MDLCIIDLNTFEGKKRVIDLMEQNLLKGNLLALKKMSNDIIESGCVRQSKETIYLSYLPYMLYKLLTQAHIVNSDKWQDNRKEIIEYLSKIEHLRMQDIISYVSNFHEHFKNVDYELYKYFSVVFKKAKVKQAARLCNLGYTFGKALSYTDADALELKDYFSNNHTHSNIKFDKNLIQKVDLISSIKEFNALIFDSSTLISLGNADLYSTLYDLKTKYPNLRMIIPNGVYEEVVSIGDKSEKFAWSAIRIKKLISDKIIELVPIEDKDRDKYIKLDKELNSIFKTSYSNMEILQKGEIECILLYSSINASLLAIDELTTRLLIESPNQLKDLMQSRYKVNIYFDSVLLNNYSHYFDNINVVRSVDLVAFFDRQGMFSSYGENILKPLLYSLKYSGCAVTSDEIDSYIQRGNK